jgi:hypothetical protein
MIEEIKNWIDLQKDEDLIEISGKTLYKILDKYNNQPDYKSAFEELKKIIDEDKLPRLCNLMSDNSRQNIEYEIKKLEQKYNLGGE